MLSLFQSLRAYHDISGVDDWFGNQGYYSRPQESVNEVDWFAECKHLVFFREFMRRLASLKRV